MKRRLLGSTVLSSLLVLGALQSGLAPAKASDNSKLDVVLQRLEKLEKENTALKGELKRIEGKAAVTEKRSVKAEKSAEAAMARAPAAEPYPVKGRVLYVRECQLYGPGFFYIPGSPGCMKIGGYARLQGAWGASGDGVVAGADSMTTDGRLTRTDSNNANYEARAVMSLDVRYPTGMGVLRGYVRGGFQNVTPFNSAATPSVFWDRGYVEFMGFTAGKQRSFFDMFDPVSSYTYGDPRTTGDTDLTGAIMVGYTQRFGSGFSASLAVEDPGAHNRGGVINMAMVEMTLGALAFDNGLWKSDGSGTLNGFNVPDIIANARYEQAWGYLGVSGAAHQVAGGYYGATNSTLNGHPADKWGFAGSAAGKFFIPGMGRDSIGVVGVYSQGAPGYATKGNVWQLYGSGGNAGFAWLPDGLYDTGTDIQLTTAWSVNGTYEHIWNPMWMTSVYGGYTAVTFNSTATADINSHLPGAAGTTPCGVPVGGSVQPPLTVSAAGGSSCSPNFSFYQVGTRTQYNPVPWLDLGVDVTWTHLNPAYQGPAILAANGAQPAGLHDISGQDVFTVIGRAQINFYPGQ